MPTQKERERELDFNKNPANDNGTDDGDGDGRPDRDLSKGGPETQNTHNTRANDSHGLGEAQERRDTEPQTLEESYAAGATGLNPQHPELGTHDADNVSGDMAIGHPRGDDPTDPPIGAKGVLPGRVEQSGTEPSDEAERDVVDNPPTAPIDVSRSKR